MNDIDKAKKHARIIRFEYDQLNKQSHKYISDCLHNDSIIDEFIVSLEIKHMKYSIQSCEHIIQRCELFLKEYKCIPSCSSIYYMVLMINKSTVAYMELVESVLLHYSAYLKSKVMK